jgi:plastocyanin
VRRRSALLTALALLAAPAAARADATITALPRDRFDPAEVTIDAGERVTFANRDVSVHDVVGDGFRSARTDPGRDSPVAGAEQLAAGRYEFFCSLHAGMRGALVVRGGTAPPPPEQPPPEQPPPPPAADTTPPKLTVRIRGRVVRVTVNEAARVTVAGRTRTTTGPRALRFRIPARARRVVVTAVDAAGNRTRVARRVPRRR